MKLPAYPKYKPSGVEWLGNVPAHWAAQGVKFCYSIQLGKMLQPEPASPTDEETPYLKSQHVQWEHVRVADLPTMWTNKNERRQYAVQDGDLLVCEGGDVGRAAVVCGAPDGTIIQNALHRVRPQGENETGYLLYVLAHAASQGWFEIICNKSTIAHFTVDKFGALGVALPTPAEQRAIAAFLDRETGRIDRLVAKKRELIERLKEKRTALISRTVTRGLPSKVAAKAGLPANPPLKPSGIDWLGDIPKHWEVKAIKWESPVKRGASPRPIDDEKFFDDEGKYAWVRIADVTAAGPFLEKTEQRMSPLGSSLSVKLKPGALFLSIAGTVGKPCITTIKCCIHDGFVYFPSWKEDTKFLFYIFASGEPYKGLGKMGTQLNLNTDTVGSIKIGLPPLPEQAAIAAYLDLETAKLDALVGKVEEAVERLQEYRTALITAAVTGKIDVREDMT